MEEINDNDIVGAVIKIMEQAEQFVDKSGPEKKAIVLANIKSLLGEQLYERYKYLIMNIIDFTIQISKGRKLNLNNKKFKKSLCCLDI